MSQCYYVCVKSDRAGLEVYLNSDCLGKLAERVIHGYTTKDAAQTCTKISRAFTDPSLVIICGIKFMEEETCLTATTKNGLEIYGNFIVISSSEDEKEPELLTWGQGIGCLQELVFPREILGYINYTNKKEEQNYDRSC